MNDNFSTNSGVVLLAVPIGAFRDLIRQVLKTAGFLNIEAVTTLRDVVHFMETADQMPSWIIATPNLNSDFNILQLLSLILSTPELHAIKVSLFYDTSAASCVPAAFELGLLSCHHAETRAFEEVDGAIKSFVNLIAFHKQDACLISAHYLRQFLKSKKAYESLLNLERNLSRLYPKLASQLLNIAKAYILLEQVDAAKSYLAQARYLDPNIVPQAEAIFRQIVGGGDTQQTLETVTFAELFQVKTCVVIDPDRSVHGPLEATLKSIGVGIVRAETDAEAAFSYMVEHGEPGMVVMEWKLAGLSCPALLQRMRQRGFCNSPIVVLSSLVKAENKSLLQELGVTVIVEKPFAQEKFLSKVVPALRASYLPSGQRAILRKVEECLMTGRIAEARELASLLFASKSNVPIETQEFIEARLAYYEGNFEAARSLITKLLRENPDRLSHQDLLGKVLLKMGDYEAAVMCFKRANSLAPDNIERICAIAEAYTELGEFDVAEEQISSARVIDGQSQHVLESTVKLGLVTGNLENARQAISAVTSSHGVLSYMNNRAVAFAKSGRHAESVNLYKDTIEILPDEQKELRALVLYNLSLAFVRQGDLAEARVNLVSASPDINKAIKPKVERVLAKVELAIATNGIINIDSSTSFAGDGETKQVVYESAPVLGLACCFGLYKAPSEESATMIPREAPKFNKRSAIQRGKTSTKKAGYAS